MSRSATNEAKTAQSTAGTNAAQYGANAAGELGSLNTQAQSLINSQGYDPTTLSAITNAGMGGVNAAFGGAAGQINRQAGRTGNTAGTAGQLDTLAMNKGIAGGQEAGNIDIQNANFANQQRMAGLNLLGSLYGTNVGAQTANEGVETGDINAQTQASPGWMQNLTGILGAVSEGAGAAIGAAKGCWIAAKLWGWFDPRTVLVREWLYSNYPTIGRLYSKVGRVVAKSKLAVSLLSPAFNFALRKAQHGN
jgi:hypothetical protein